MTQNPPAEVPWWSTAVYYQIYPRSFADGNDDGTGDLVGARERLPYLAELGIDALWLSPFYRSPMADGGYDVADPCDVDPIFGTLADFDALLADAHALGIMVTIDIVPNHFSEQHPWFQAVLAGGPDAPERDYFVIRPGRGADGSEPPNNWPAAFGGSAWARLPDGEWYLHLFAPEQPDLDWTNPAVPAEFDRIMRFWLDRGVDGFRVDVANSMAKEPGLPDMDLSVLATHDEGGTMPTVEDIRWDRPEVHTYLRGFRTTLEDYPGDRMAVGEAWVADAVRLARYVRPDELSLTFNFELVTAPWDAAKFRSAIERSLDAMAEVGAACTWVLSNHDVTRVASRYAIDGSDSSDGSDVPDGPDGFDGFDGSNGSNGATIGVARARAAALMQLALPGAAFVYNGDELGLLNVELPDEALQDPVWERSGHTERGRDGERVPLPWSGDASPFGFSASAEPWLPMPAGWAGVSAAVQHADPASTLNFYRAALTVRRGLATDRTVTWLDAPAGCLVFRAGDLTVALNAGTSAVPLPTGELVLASGPVTDELPPDTAVWLR